MMGDLRSSAVFRAILVGGPAGSFARHVIRLLSNYEIGFVQVDNVYEAVAVLAKDTEHKFVVIGRLEELNKENERLFEILAKADSFCWCLSKDNPAKKRAAIKANNVRFIEKPEQIETLLRELFSTNIDAAVKEEKPVSQVNDLNEVDFRPTQAELNALLGNQPDENF